MTGDDASAESILARLSALEVTVGAHEANAMVLIDAVSARAARELDYQRQEANLEQHIERLEASFAEQAESHRSLTDLEHRIETLETQGQQVQSLLQQLTDLASMDRAPSSPQWHVARPARSQTRRRTA